MSSADPSFNPYQAPSAVLEEVNPSARGGWVLAERGARFLAALVDNLVTAILVGIPAAFAFGSTSDGVKIGAAILAFVIALGWLAYNLSLVSRQGQTFGKKVMNVAVRRSQGDMASLGRIIVLRNLVLSLAGAIPLVGPLVGIVDALFIFRQDRRCLHDLIADTVVIDVGVR